MKKLSLIILPALIIAIGTVCPAQDLKSAGSKVIAELTKENIQMTIPEVGREVDRVVMDNGLVLYLYEDHRLPLFNLGAMIRCGDIYDPPDKDGLSGLVGTVMRTGGSKSISGDSLNILTEFIGGTLETRIGPESGSANLNVLSKDIDLGLRLFTDLLRNPAFPQDKLDLAKADVRNEIRRRNDNPTAVVDRYFDNLVYGNHPYGIIREWNTVKNITVQDLIDYHKRFFAPNNIMIAISGDFTKADIIAKLKEYLGDWPKSSTPLPPIPAVKFKYNPGVFEVKKDISQGYILLGQLGVRRDNPDVFAIDLLNYILGGGSFTSRLTSKVRSDEGLAYHVSSSFGTSGRDYGTFKAECQTKCATTYKAIKLMTDEIKKIRTAGVSGEELEDARNSFINRFVFRFDNPGKIVQNLMSLEFDGRPADYYKTYIDNCRKVTAADIKKAANKYLRPDQLTYVVVGMPDRYEKPLSEFGKITEIELKDPDLQ